jgi:hypothetical protein
MFRKLDSRKVRTSADTGQRGSAAQRLAIESLQNIAN